MKERNGGAKFCIFLVVVESLGFTYSAIMGIICLFQVESV